MSKSIDEFAKELAKQVPVKEVYGDLAAPAARQTGQLLADITKVISLALAPVQYLAAQQDRFPGISRPCSSSCTRRTASCTSSPDPWTGS